MSNSECCSVECVRVHGCVKCLFTTDFCCQVHLLSLVIIGYAYLELRALPYAYVCSGQLSVSWLAH